VARWVSCPSRYGGGNPTRTADGKGAGRAATGECVEAVEEKKGGQTAGSRALGPTGRPKPKALLGPNQKKGPAPVGECVMML